VAIDVYKDWLGIPEENRPPNHYQLLRVVQFEDDPDKVRKHYKKLNGHVRKYATGQYSIESQDLLNELAMAMLCLTDPQRKREYDEGLGREFHEDDESGQKPMLQVLCNQGHLTNDQIHEVESFASARGLSNRDAVVQMKLTDPITAAQALAKELGLSFVDLEDMLPDDSVLDKVPRSLVKRNSILPLFVDDDVLLVAGIDLPEFELEDEMRLRFEKPMRTVLAAPLAVNQAIAKYYAPGARDEAALEEAESATPKSGKKGKAAKAKNKKPKHKMTEAEKSEKMMMEIIITCWAVVGSGMFDQYVLKAFVLPTSFTFPYITSAIVAPLAGVYWFFLRDKK